MNRLIFAVMTLLLGLLVTSTAHAQDELYEAQTIPCPEGIANAAFYNFTVEAAIESGLKVGVEVEGETYSCGLVTVPEDYNAPDGRTINLFYVKLHSYSQSPAPDPLIYLSGGPGGSGSDELSTNQYLLSNINSIRERRDVYAYDQRGTGYSQYLVCAPYLSTIGVALEQDESIDAGILGELMGGTFQTKAFANAVCGMVYNELTAVDLSQYNSVVSAQDVVHLADALGHAEFNLYGTSYGTKLSLNLMDAAPDRVRSVVLDGVAPRSESNMANTLGDLVETYVQIFEMCAADAACNAAYPNLSERFATMLNQLEATPLVIDPPIVLHPALAGPLKVPVLDSITTDFFSQLPALNNGQLNGGMANRVPRMIVAVEEGDADWFRDAFTFEFETPGPAASPTYEEINFDQPLFELPITALLTAALTEAAQRNQSPALLWSSIVLSEFESRVLAGDSQDEIIIDLVLWTLLPYQEATTIDSLVQFASEHLSIENALLANLVAQKMSADDLRETIWHITELAMVMGFPTDSHHVSNAYQFAVNCNEDGAFVSIEDTLTYLENSPYPQIRMGTPDLYEIYTWGSCITYPKTLGESVISPVISNIPALIFNGRLDTQTPYSSGEYVHENLANSFLVSWDNMGHIAAGHDTANCVGDIAAAFFANPTREPNLSCSQSDAYKLQWMLPE